MSSPRVYVAPPDRGRWLLPAIAAGAARVVAHPGDADAVVWVAESDGDGLRDLLDAHPGVRWVQLPWAGIGPFVPLLDHDRVWTCAKGAYSRTTAEHALMLALAGFRDLHRYARATTWGTDHGRSLHGAAVTVVGGGGIAQEFLRLLDPFGCRTTAVRRSAVPVPHADRTLTTEHLDDALATADLVVLALALTPASRHLLGPAQFAAMPDHAYLVNVARGAHVDTDALVGALRDGAIRGAGLDVTDPEPLPDGHPLWELPNVIITPHAANTREMARPYLARRVEENVRRFGAGQPLEGVVDPDLGY